MEIETRGMTFPARTAGPDDGRPVLLLHGFPQSSLEWRAQLDALAKEGYRAIAVDQRGYAATNRPAEVAAYAMDELVADVIGIADALGAPHLDVVGHDWGGAVAWHVAGRHPDRLRTLTIVSTPHPLAFGRAMRSGGDQAGKSAYIHFFRQEGVAEDALLADGSARLRAAFAGLADPAVYVDMMSDRATLTGGLNWYRASSFHDAQKSGAVVGVPTLYVWGADDIGLGREAAEGSAAHVEGPYRFVELPDVGHWVPETAADTLNELLLDHLSAY